MSRNTLAIGLVVLVCGLLASLAQAELFGLEVEHYPRVRSTGMLVEYDADGGPGGVGLLTASGWTTEFYEAEGEDEIWLYDGDFDLQVVIDPLTGEALSGSLNVTGDPYGSLIGLFHSNTLTNFGFGGNDLMEFLFVQEGDMVAPDGEEVGIIISGVSIPGTPPFSQDFSNNYNGYGNAFYLPEPTTMLLLSVGVGVVCLRRRRRRTV